MWSLLHEPWLLARTADQGEAAGPQAGARSAERAVGVRELLLDAHRFRDIEVDIPTQKPAIFRQLLLPIVVDALGFPKDAADWAQRFARGAFSDAEREGLVRYFDTYGECFDLFSETDPFAQVAGLRTAKGETKTSALLVATAAQGNNVPLFSSRTDADPLELTPAEAARWLLHTHCWDTGAIKTGVEGDGQAKSGKTTGNPVGPLGQLGVVMLRGTTLYQTLLLNVPYGETRRDGDLPQWRRREREGDVTGSTATPSWQTRPAAGPLETWTWQARRVLLVREQAADGSERVTRPSWPPGTASPRSPRTTRPTRPGGTRVRRRTRGARARRPRYRRSARSGTGWGAPRGAGSTPCWPWTAARPTRPMPPRTSTPTTRANCSNSSARRGRTTGRPRRATRSNWS